MNETNGGRTITLKDLWDLLTQRVAVIVLAAVIAAGAFFAVDMATYDPQYSSTATLYILRQNSESVSSGEAANELTLALRLVYDCNYFLKSRTVLDTVISDLGLDMSYGELYSRVSTNNPANTRVLEITVRGDTPEQAKAIVDRICDIGPGKIEEAMGFSQVNLYEYGTTPGGPSNRPGAMKYGVAAVAAAVLVYGAFLVMFILDDRLRSDEDIEKALGLNVLAEIPHTGGGQKIYGKYAYGKPGRFGDSAADGGEKRS